MKKFFVSVGLAAAGTASLQAAYTPESADNSKMWSVSATLRSFYDDNYNTTHSDVKGSFGEELSPSFNLHVPLSQTEFGIQYTYGLYYYQERESLGENPYDQTHQFDLWMDHAFNARWHTKVQDSFVVAQDPDLIPQGGTEQRANGNNIANTASILLDTDWTRLFSTEIGYHNSFYDYQQSGGTAAAPSLAGLLNRVEQTANIDFQWHVKPTTVAFFGYQYGQDLYLGNEPIAPQETYLVLNPVAHLVTVRERFSQDRDSLSHYVYVGVNHQFLENLTGNARIGVQYSDNYADPIPSTSISPYLDASLIYTYATASYAQVGITHSRNATTAVSLDSNNGTVAEDEETTAVYGSVNYQVTQKLTASTVMHFQYGIYNGGSVNNQSDQFYNLGLNLNYAFTHHFSGEVGYNFDYYTSAIPLQSYTRDRYYLGLTASY
jgi:hypothetical protein